MASSQEPSGEPIDVHDLQVAFSPDGRALDIVLRELRAARNTLDASLFCLSHKAILDALCEVSARGHVRVRLLLDVEAASPSERHVVDRLTRHGVRAYVLPVPNGRMHLKCAVIDGGTVITGAANWTPQAFERNIEDTLVLRSAALGSRYGALFEQLIAQAQPQAGSHGGAPSASEASRVAAAAPSKTMAERAGLGAQATPFFCPGRSGPRRLCGQIGAATGRVDVAMYLLTDPAVVKALVDKARSRTATVRVLVDAGMLSGPLRSVLQGLADAGAEVRCWIGDRRSLHLKNAVIDGRYVWSGSANWTAGAFDRNVEDMVVFEGPALAAAYLQFMDTLYSQATPFEPIGRKSAVAAVDPRRMREGFVVGLPPTGARTNWRAALSARPAESWETVAAFRYLPDEEYQPVLLDLLRSARQSILVSMYVIPAAKAAEPLKTQVMDALAAAAHRGVYVYCLLHTPPGEGDVIARDHDAWADHLRSKGIDVRLHVPSVPVHDKLVVVDLAKVLLGSHNWTEGALSGARVHEASALLILPRQDPRWADYVLGRETVADMRSREHWQEELRQLRHLSGLSGSARETFVRQLEAAP